MADLNLVIDTRDAGLRDLSRVLNVVDTDKRVVAYYGVGEAIADRYLTIYGEVDSLGEVIINITKLVDIINEIAIIDRALFSSILKKAFDYRIKRHLNYTNTSNFNNSINFEEFVGLSQFYSRTDIDLINKDFTTFRAAYTVMSITMDRVFDDLKVR